MKASSLLLATPTLLLTTPLVHALTTPDGFKFALSKRATTSSNITVANNNDVFYLVNVTVGGQDYLVELDTSSSDLWVNARSNTTFANQTNTYLPYTYGTGQANGFVSYANLTIGDYTVPSQAFINSNNTSELQGFDVDGVMGLGFDTSSIIYSSNSSAGSFGLSILSQIFRQNMSATNFITLDLSRDLNATYFINGTTNATTSNGIVANTTSSLTNVTDFGALTIGTYNSNYTAIANSTKIPLSPSNTTRWQIAVGNLSVNEQNFSMSQSGDGTDTTQTTALLNTILPGAIISDAAAAFIYGQAFPGAKACNVSNMIYWIVPCNGSANVSFNLGGQDIPIHPLDLSDTLPYGPQNGTNGTICFGKFFGDSAVPSFTGGPNVFNLGVNFLRNVYTVFNYGNATLFGSFTNAPSVQFFPKTNFSSASAEFQTVRAAALQTLPAALDPQAVNCSLISPV